MLKSIDDEVKRADSLALLAIFTEVSGCTPKVWGNAIVGFIHTEYTNSSGRHEWFTVGFAPRKSSLTLYLGYSALSEDALLNRLGSHEKGKACLYIKSLDSIDTAVLKKLISVAISYGGAC